MDREDLKSILLSRNINVWFLINTAMNFAASDHGSELRLMREGIVQKMYATDRAKKIRSWNKSGQIAQKRLKINGDYEQIKNFLLESKELLKVPNQSSELLTPLLEKLGDVDMTVEALKETDIGRAVNALRKHATIEVQKMAKQIIKKWKSIVDDWNKKITENENLLPVTSCLTSKSTSNLETVEEPPLFSTSAMKNEQVNTLSEEKRPENARKRLGQNYQEAENAKKQRGVKTMELPDIPKRKGNLIIRMKCRPNQKNCC